MGDRFGSPSPNDGAGRYWVKHDRIALDTRPGEFPEMPTDILPEMEPYLRLFAHRVSTPTLYAVVQERGKDSILLLEHSAIYPEGAQATTGAALMGTLMPTIAEVWQQSSALRQLTLLWQIAQLWQPLSLEKVASTLLDMALLRVDGGTLRLLDLKFDRAPSPTLVDLGQLWSQWQVQSEIAEFFSHVCQNLIQGKIVSAEQLVDSLDQALTAQGQQQARQIQFATFTDQGPTRQRNEDACFPPSGTRAANDQTLPLVIVCDGIGGHEGGEVASQLAIEAISNQARQIPVDQPAETVSEALAEAVFNANDAISQRNDLEQRQERQRMGTTVVMGLAHAHELYITHVGDSRAYRITRTGCYQVTVDDDVASREVRLGYTLYRPALQHPAAGSLVQALGMGSSHYLHPNVQRFVIDEDCVFLLCSDGLSDNDRVEEFWHSEIAPILDGKLDVATAVRNLVEIANTHNGHDNVTVALLHCQVNDRATVGAAPQAIPVAMGQPTQMISPTTTLQPQPVPSTLKTQLVRPESKPWLKILLSLFGLLGIGGVLAIALVPEIRNTILYRPIPSASPSPAVTASSSPTPPTALTVGSWVQVKPSENGATSTLELLETPNRNSPPDEQRRIPSGTILKVEETRKDPFTWLKLKVCQVGTPASGTTAGTTLTQWKAGDTAWQQETTIAPFVETVKSPPERLGDCTRSTTDSPSPANPKDNVPQSP